MVAENRREKDEAKKETANKTAAHKVCLQHKKSEAFQQCQDCMDNISSPSEGNVLNALFSYLSAPSRAPLSASEVSWATSQIKEGQQ